MESGAAASAVFVAGLVTGRGRAAAAGSLICETVGRACAEAFASGARALILTGSLARDEATFAATGAGLVLRGDAEFLLLFGQRAPLPSGERIAALERSIESSLAQRSLRAKVVLSPCHPSYLRRMRPHIFAYELRACGRVVWGDRDVLSLVPDFSPGEIPGEDAFRLLCNRLLEQLAPLARLEAPAATVPADLRYRTTKLYLDMATSFLVFVGGYVPTYRGRAESLERLARCGRPGEAPLPLRAFAERVASCTRVKLGLQPEGGGDGWLLWQEGVLHAHALWRWELGRLTGAPEGRADRELWERWRRRQPPVQRLRGWLHVVRARGWHRSWRHWPRWARLGLRASPRLSIYEAGTGLLFALPELLARPGHSAGEPPPWGWLSDLLPVPPAAGGPCGQGWQQIASAVYLNYQDFLVGTRS